MAQSKPSYGANTPKDSARTRRERQNINSDAESAETRVEPACRSRAVGHSIEKREWCVKSFTEKIAEFYQPCGWPKCYPDGPPDVEDVEEIVRASHLPTSYHRPRATPTDAQSPTSGDDEKPAGEQETVGTITDLCEGEAVVWEGQRWSMRVVETTSEPDGVVCLLGANGGEYRIEGRPNAARPYAIYPSIGVVEELCRVVPVDDHPRPEPEKV